MLFCTLKHIRLQHGEYKEYTSSVSMFIFWSKLSGSSECNVRNDGIAYVKGINMHTCAFSNLTRNMIC